MELDVFGRGLLIGVAVAAPVGPIGLLCIRRTLAEGRVSGLVSGIGAATADAFYAVCAAFGLAFITSLLLENGWWLRLAGGLFLVYLGIGTFLAPPAERAAASRGTGLWAAYGSTFLLTISNPMTILAFTAIFAGIGPLATDYAAASMLVAGVFAGSALWWLTLSGGVSLLQTRITTRWMIWINRGAGIILVLAGVLSLAGFL